MPKNPPIRPLKEPAHIWYGSVVPNLILLLNTEKYILTAISTAPKIVLNVTSFISERRHIDRVEIMRKMESMGISLFRLTFLLYFHAATAEVVRASSPDKAVASPYEGIRKGSIVIMKMPKPKPVVR